MPPIIEVKDLCKEFRLYRHRKGFLGAFGNLFSRQHTVVHAVDHVSFAIERGEIVGYLGPNGAGKSTTIKMLTGILVPTSGQVLVNGHVPHRERKLNAQRIGVVFGQRTHLWFDLPVEESFELLRHIYRIPAERYRQNVALFHEVLELGPFFRTPVRQLSLGQRMRADIAAALLHNPEIVFLDEPTIGLDVVAKERIRQFIHRIRRERQVTILLTTHDLDDVEKLCDRVVLIDQARIVFEGTLDDIRKLIPAERVLVVDFAEDYPDVKLRHASIVHRQGQRVQYRFSPDEISMADLIREILSRFQIADLAVQEPEIEEVVRKIYEHQVLLNPR